MKLYEITYSLQNNVSLKSYLEEFCDETNTCDGKQIFIKTEPHIGEKIYVISEDEDIVKETLNVRPLYTISSVFVILFAIYILFIGFKLNLIDMMWYVPTAIGAVGVFIVPYWMMNYQPSEFYPESQPLFGLSRFNPLPFQQHTQISVMVYLTTLAAGIVLLPVVFPNPNVLATVFPVSISAVFFAWQDGFDPSSDITTVITTLTLLPFAIPLINLGIYTQRSIYTHQNMAIIHYIIPDDFNQLTQAIGLIYRSETVWLLFMNLTTILVMFFVLKSIADGAGRIGVYKMPHSISDKKHLRAGLSVLFITYVGGSISLFISQLFGHPIVPVNTVFHGILIYWPLLVIVPIWFIVWYWNPWSNSIDIPRNVSESAIEVDGIPVLFRDLGDIAAFPVLRDEPVIVLHERLEQNLTDDEIQAICYHEIYHINHNSVKYQDWVDIPVVGYVLFLFRTNLSELFNEEYAADEFAAANVGVEAVISAVKTVDSMDIGRSGSLVQNNIKTGWQGYVHLLFSPPVLSLYSPPRHHRITRLEEDATPD